MEDDFVKINNFFDNLFDIYILKDLEQLNAINSDEQGHGSCAIPMALAIFSSIELIGYLLREDNPKIDKKGESEANIKTFINNLMNTCITESEKNYLIQQYRNGMAHSFFPQPKGKSSIFGIVKNPYSTELFLKYSNVITLNVSQLYKCFLDAITKLRKELFIDKNQNKITHFARGLKDTDFDFFQNKIYPWMPTPEPTAMPYPIASKK